MASVKDIKYDVGHIVSFKNVYDESKIDNGIVSMITINKKGIRYRVSYPFGLTKAQRDIWQDELIG